MARRRHHTVRTVIVREHVPQERPSFVANREAHLLRDLCIIAGIAVILVYDHAWYWWLATILISGPEIIPTVAGVVNRLIVAAMVWLGDWVEVFFEEAD